MAEVFYVMSDGYIVTSSEMSNSFHIVHGCWPSDDPAKFDRWITTLKRKTIRDIVPEESMTISRLAPIRKVPAIKLYRERTGCTLREAREYVDNLLGESKIVTEIDN